eukprot:scaffold1503_cov150-Ochromonas_danica.AAC.1
MGWNLLLTTGVLTGPEIVAITNHIASSDPAPQPALPLAAGEELAELSSGIRELALQQKGLQEMIAPMVEKMRTKVGSDLGRSEVGCFNLLTISSSIEAFDFYVEKVDPSSNECRYVYEEILKYTQEMVANAEQRKVNEEIYVHKPTFALMRKLVTHFLGNANGTSVQFFEKGSGGAVDICYETFLPTAKGILPIKGETDQVISVEGAPVGNVEIKNLTMTCSTPREHGEILAEDKGLAERHKNRVGIEPRLFPSVLLSGRRWVFVDRTFRETERYLMFPVLHTFDVNEVDDGQIQCTIIEANVMMVSRMLIRMIHAMGKLVKAITKSRQKAYDVFREENDQSDDDEPENDDFDKNKDDDAVAKEPSAFHPNRPSAGTASSSKTKTTKGGRGSKHVQSNLTRENLFRHDLNTFWQRVTV